MAQVWGLRIDWGVMIFFFFMVKLDFCSFDQEHFCLYTSRKNSVGFLSVSLPGTPWSASQHHRSVSHTILKKKITHYSNCCFDSAVHFGNSSNLALEVEWNHWAPTTRGSSYFYCIDISQFTDCSLHCKVWPTEQIDHRAFQRMLWLLRIYCIMMKEVCLPDPPIVGKSEMTNPFQHSSFLILSPWIHPI